MTREQRIKRGLVWQVSPPTMPDDILFEGSKTECAAFIKRPGNSGLSCGKLLWEAEPPPTLAGELQKILDLPMNDAGERVIPPGFLDNARELLKDL